jgi:DNA-binding HxlR family transcriptional regulator
VRGGGGGGGGRGGCTARREAQEEEGGLRSGVLQKKTLGISNKMFTQTVRDLEKDGLISRKIYPVVPPKVEYKLSSRGKSI